MKNFAALKTPALRCLSKRQAGSAGVNQAPTRRSTQRRRGGDGSRRVPANQNCICLFAALLLGAAGVGFGQVQKTFYDSPSGRGEGRSFGEIN